MKLKTILFFGGLFVLCYGAWNSYYYFFDCTTPSITITGIAPGNSYAGVIALNIEADKSGELICYLDDHRLNAPKKISAKKSYSFEIDTKTLEEGYHLCKISCVSSSYHQKSAQEIIPFHVDNNSLHVSLVGASERKILQGRTCHFQIQANKPIKNGKINAFGRNHDLIDTKLGTHLYEAFVPVVCEELAGTYPVSLEIIDHVGNVSRLVATVEVVPAEFKREALKVDAQKMVQEQELGQDDKIREQLLAKAAEQSAKEKFWRGPFCTPIDIQRISCEFGTIRTTQKKGRYAHKALDLVNVPKSVVWAPQDGTVVLKDRFVHSGNTVAIDHGCGLISLFYHLDDFAKIEVGDRLVKGNPIGTIGKTGYATGYHLHWEMRLANIPVEPMEWTTSIF